MSKVIQIAVSLSNGHDQVMKNGEDRLYALKDDGSIWHQAWDGFNKVWVEMQGPPQENDDHQEDY